MQNIDRIASVVANYDAQGLHRTATLVDEASAAWLADEISAIGLTPHLLGFELDRVDPIANHIDIAGRRIAGVPLFDCRFTDPGGLTGRIGLPGSNADILLVQDLDADALFALRTANQARAIVLVSPASGTSASATGLSLLNAESFKQPFGPPVLQVDSAERDWLNAQSRIGAEATLVAHVARQRVTAHNVVAQIEGTGAPVAISTPRSGWWQVAAERGAGIACWLEVMRAVRHSTLQAPFFFCANSGHELGYIGMEATLDHFPHLVRDATWLHFGANIGARTGTSGTFCVSNADLAAIAQPHLETVSRKTGMMVGASDGGEMDCVFARGGSKFMALTNDNACFHTPADRYPGNVDVDLIAQYADACAAIAMDVAAEVPMSDNTASMSPSSAPKDHAS